MMLFCILLSEIVYDSLRYLSIIVLVYTALFSFKRQSSCVGWVVGLSTVTSVSNLTKVKAGLSLWLRFDNIH